MLYCFIAFILYATLYSIIYRQTLNIITSIRLNIILVYVVTVDDVILLCCTELCYQPLLYVTLLECSTSSFVCCIQFNCSCIVSHLNSWSVFYLICI